jgi:hypothetical protein
MKPVDILPSLFKIHFNIILSPLPSSSYENFVCISVICATFLPIPSSLIWSL